MYLYENYEVYNVAKIFVMQCILGMCVDVA
jgi:hypothetical protein